MAVSEKSKKPKSRSPAKQLNEKMGDSSPNAKIGIETKPAEEAPAKTPCDVRTRTKKEMRAITKHYTRLAYKITREAIKLAEHLQNWVDKNSQPKKVDLMKLWCYNKREPSRFAKRGPMTRRDWVRFYNWAAKNAVPKEPAAPPQEPAKKKKKLKAGEEPPTLAQIVEHIDKLASPRRPRKKYEFPPKPDYAYSPQIEHNAPAKKDKGRPFPPPKVPKRFQHIDVETDFWSKLRFPVRPATRLYVPTENILRLALPRITPTPWPHCPIPEKPAEYVAPRRRMTPRQWRDHKRRLQYLAEPVYRPIFDVFYYG